jgi:hypothetical protein
MGGEMKKVEFIQNKSIGMEAYNCGCNFNNDKYCQLNHSGTYVLASEAAVAVSNANADWVERCRSFRQQDADEATERERVLVEVYYFLCEREDKSGTYVLASEANKEIDRLRKIIEHGIRRD